MLTGRISFVALVGCLLAHGVAVATAAGDTLTVVGVEPAPRSLSAPVNSPIVVHFDRPVDPSSITNGDNLWAFGRWSGTVAGTYSFSDGDRTVTLSPGRPFSAGESVMVILSHVIQAADGSPMRSAGYSYQFWTRAQPAVMDFSEIDRLTTRTTPSQPSQAYGGIASDLNGDRYPDITIVNEISADLRVFLNKADGTGLFHPFIQPTFPVGDRASPSEPSDFNRDGLIDICVANIGDDTVSILLGNGDGTFAPQQTVSVGADPRGIAVLDADGDGDVDIVNTNAGSGTLNMSLLLNDGTGVFGVPTFFPAGAPGAWALAAADMNEDGILDLAIGARDAEQILVHAGDGDGTFTPVSMQSAGGSVWMLVTGDVDGDGSDDVATINSFDNNGSILRGDGNGNLGLPETYTADPFGLATDLGDTDGDGDLDWVTSSFSGNWRLNTNNGDGTFTFAQDFEPEQASSCSLMLDLDNDGDLDLALIDESADEVILMQNSSVGPGAKPPGVPNGQMATTPLTVGKLDPGGVDISVSWDTLTCTGAITDYQIIFGGGSQLPATPGGIYGLDGSECGIGTRSPYSWLNSPDPASDPSGLIWFLVVANDGSNTEGSWGKDSAGNERSGVGMNGASAECGMTDKDLSNTCGQ